MDSGGQSRDCAAEFEGIFRRHGAFVGRVLRRFGVRPADVPDASQDVFLVVYRRLPEFEQRAAHRSWLYRICACVAADYRKRAHRRYERTGDEPVAAGAPGTQERSASERQLAARLERALDALRDDQRQVFVLYELEELSMHEVAALLGCPLKTAFTRLYAARRQLADELRHAGYAGLPGALGVLAPWPGFGTPELRAALRALGSEGVATGGATASAVSAAVLPVVQPAAPAAYASALGAIASGAFHAGSTAGLLALVAVGMLALDRGPGPVLAYEDGGGSAALRLHTRGVRYHITPRAVAPSEIADPVPRKRARPRAPLPREQRPAGRETTGATGVAAETTAADIRRAPEPRWLRAPEPGPQRRAAEAGGPQVGLDEVLAATSIDGLMRFAPLEAGGKGAFVLVPERANAPKRGRARAVSEGRSDR